MSQHVAKVFRFPERWRDRLTFSDATKIRLNPTTRRLQLKIQSYDRVTGAAVYPTDTDLTVSTRVENPDTLRGLLGFDPYPRDADQPNNTNVRYKINDGTDDRFWDGGAWSVAGAADWNTALEVVQHIVDFPVTDRKFGLVINLVTTDSSVTPTLHNVDLLMDLDVDYFRSIISESLVPSIKEKIRPVIDEVFDAPGGTLCNLRDLETAYNLISVDAVYNDTDDPNHATTLLSSYDATSKVVTLISAVDRGKALWVRFTIEPEVYLNFPSQDYTEVEKIPAVVIDSVELVGNEIIAQQSVRNEDAKNASVRRSPFRLHIKFDVRLLAKRNRTLLSMMDKALAHASDTRLLPWPALDEEISLSTKQEGLFGGRPNLSDVHETSYTLILNDLHLFFNSEETVPLVENFNLTLATPRLQGGPKWVGTKTG